MTRQAPTRDEILLFKNLKRQKNEANYFLHVTRERTFRQWKDLQKRIDDNPIDSLLLFTLHLTRTGSTRPKTDRRVYDLPTYRLGLGS
jgi:hypothetical protein